ncbi:hypothetical protein Tco_0422649 [Tanacetum coccineum]
MVAYLKKPSGSEGFHEIVDFLNGRHIRYALTKNPTIYVSLIKKFWQTATVRTVDNGKQEITATVDGKEFTVTKASVRIHLQLADVDEEVGEGSGHPFKPQPPPSIPQPTNEESIPNVVSSSHQKTSTPRQALNQVTELPQTSEPIPNIPDEAIYEEWDDRVERATTTTASLDAEQASGVKGAVTRDVENGFIRPMFHLGVHRLILFKKGMDGSMRLCIEYREHNHGKLWIHQRLKLSPEMARDPTNGDEDDDVRRVFRGIETEIGVCPDIDSSISSGGYQIYIDASKKGLGCVLMQQGRKLGGTRLKFQYNIHPQTDGSSGIIFLHSHTEQIKRFGSRQAQSYDIIGQLRFWNVMERVSYTDMSLSEESIQLESQEESHEKQQLFLL